MTRPGRLASRHRSAIDSWLEVVDLAQPPRLRVPEDHGELVAADSAYMSEARDAPEQASHRPSTSSPGSGRAVVGGLEVVEVDDGQRHRAP